MTEEVCEDSVHRPEFNLSEYTLPFSSEAVSSWLLPRFLLFKLVSHFFSSAEGRICNVISFQRLQMEIFLLQNRFCCLWLVAEKLNLEGMWRSRMFCHLKLQNKDYICSKPLFQKTVDFINILFILVYYRKNGFDPCFLSFHFFQFCNLNILTML